MGEGPLCISLPGLRATHPSLGQEGQPQGSGALAGFLLQWMRGEGRGCHSPGVGAAQRLSLGPVYMRRNLEMSGDRGWVGRICPSRELEAQFCLCPCSLPSS